MLSVCSGGEELVKSLSRLCEKEKITAGSISGIGATDHAVVGLYEVEQRQYHKTELNGEMELASLTGNVSAKDGAVYLHLHTTFADEKARCFGGHLYEAVISATCELFLRRYDGTINRTVDEATGLNVFDF